MAQVEVERFLGRLITDADFRARATASLKDVCYENGITLTPTEMLLLSRCDFNKFGQLSESIDDSIRRN